MTCKAILLAFVAMLPMIGRASNITLQGNFAADDGVQLFSVSILAPAVVDIRSYGYGGGTTSTSAMVPSGGFDTVFTLFSASGVFIGDNDDGSGAATDPATGLAGDARITASLTAGTYTLALTQYDNFSIGSLADGFVESGNRNFTADSAFAGGGACPGNMFRDISGSAARCRNGNWAIDFVNVGTVAEASVPEPSAFALAGCALLLLFWTRSWSRWKTTLLGAVVLGASAQAQTTSAPDYSTTKDFTGGQRNLLNVTDLQIASYNLQFGDIWIHPITTTNSQQADGTEDQLILRADEAQIHAYSARMFNQPQAVMVTASHSSQFGPPGYLVLVIQNAPGRPASYVTGPTPITSQRLLSGAVADLNGDGFDEVAMSLDDGLLVVLSANDPNNISAGSRLPGTPAEKLYAMAAGDFYGDGKREIAGIANTADGGAKLVIYSVDPNTLLVSLAASLPLTTPGASTADPVSTWSLTRGRFNTTSRDQLGVAFARSGGPGYVEVVDINSTGTLIEHPAGIPAGDTAMSAGFVQIGAGQFGLPSSSFDQIAYLSASPNPGGRFLEILSVDQNTLGIAGNNVVPYNQWGCSWGMSVGNFDHRTGTGGYNPSSQVALTYGDCSPGGTVALNIYSFDGSNNFSPTAESARALPDLHQRRNDFVDIALVATDLQGRSMVLGDPAEITINAGVQPAVVAGIPPMHMDFIQMQSDTSQPPIPFNVSAIPDGFFSTYSLEQSAGNGASSTNGTSWSFGAKEKVSAGFSLGNPDVTGLSVTDTFTAAQSVKGSADKTHGTYQGQSVKLTLPSGADDSVNYTNDTIHIWAYPVIGKTVCPAATPACPDDQKVPLTIQFSAVDGDAKITNEEGYNLHWYQPVWEPFNIFSYPTNLNQLQAANPNLAVLSVPETFTTDGTSVTEEVTWEVKDNEEAHHALKQNYSFENDFSASLKEGIPAVESNSQSFDIDVSGSVGFNSLIKNTTDLGLSTGFTLFKTGTFPQPQTYAYTVNPYILGVSQPGGLVDNVPLESDVTTFSQVRVAYTVNINTDQQQWWKRMYGQNIDVALNHPSRWQVEGVSQAPNGGTNCLATGKVPAYDCLTLSGRIPSDGWASVYHQMRGFFISKAEFPGQGPQLQESKADEKLQLQARIYNYSLASLSTGSTVHVQFFFAPYNSNATAIDDSNDQLIKEVVLDGTTLLPFDAGIPSTRSDPNWVLASTTFDPSQFAYTKGGGVAVAFWVLTWVEDADHTLVQEISGHGLNQKPPSAPLHVPSFQAAAALEQCQADGCYSNNLGLYHVPYWIDAPGLGAQPGPLPGQGSFNLGKLDLSVARVLLGKDVSVSTQLSTGGVEAPGAVVKFYDGDPKHDGRAFGRESIPHISAGSQPLVRTTYRANQCGMHQLYAVLNEGKPTEIVRRAQPLQVSCDAF